MPSTRSSNKDADFKVFYAKKVPKQKYFPHRRKTVRRPDPAQDVPEKRQMTFLPEMMRRQQTVQDSEDEDLDAGMDTEEDMEEGGASIAEAPKKTVKGADRTAARMGKKRSNDVLQGDFEEDEERVRPMPKRRRKAAAPKKRRSDPVVKPECDEERSLAPSETETKEATKRRRRRQSTMTQIIDGRRPTPDIKDPIFKPAKKSLRTSRGGKDSREMAETAKRQRTLTQMVPGLVPLGIMLDGDMGERQSERSESQEHNDAFIRSLAEEGLFHPEDGNGANVDAAVQDESTEQLVAEHGRTPSRQNPSPVVAKYTKSSTSKSTMSRFGLLSTPEKRRVFEIPSSQSPSDSPLTTQVTPRRLGRSPLKPCAGNLSNIAETPSKRRKQVNFRELNKEQIPPPPALRKFASVIQDSEDEDGTVSEDNEAPNGQHDIGPETQALVHCIDEPLPGLDVGAKTQAVLHSIDRACANARENIAWINRESSEELGDPFVNQNDEKSQELGEQPSTPMIMGNDSSDEEAEPAPPPLHSASVPHQHSCTEHNQGPQNLDEQPIQVPCSPSPNPETQQSYSNKAEEQLHSEYQTYSQYRPSPLASSMHVAPEPGFSYQATPFPPHLPTQQVQHSGHISQATTIDPTQPSPKSTPRKARSQPVRSARTTPNKIPSSMPFVSPNRPPPLLIPSSFPSPDKVMAGWSSPLTGRSSPIDGRSPDIQGKRRGVGIAESQWTGEASWENFSIPAPPPALDISDDELGL